MKGKRPANRVLLFFYAEATEHGKNIPEKNNRI